MRSWWARHHKEQLPARLFDDVPVGVVLREFYRSSAQRLRQLEAMRRSLQAEERTELRQLQDMFSEKERPSLSPFARLERGGEKALTGRDPIFEKWVEQVKNRDIPLEWFGPKLREKMKAKREAASRGKA